MHSIQVLATVAGVLATTAFAHPKRVSFSPSAEQAKNSCGDEQTLACCNSENVGGHGKHSLFGSLGLNQLLGGNCQAITVPGEFCPGNSDRSVGIQS